ncbi:MAG TPA: AAA family ATPase [Candidatus Sulfotelmatobacter sp.]|jgi:ATP-dependent Lon protease|nr:AAA family ATPase [Candidatus Sulfotelmatobacter sp.]
MDPAQDQPSLPQDLPKSTTPTTGGGSNGDNSTINGDKPIAVPPSSAIAQQQEATDAIQVQTTAAAQTSNGTITQVSARDSNGQSYDQIRALGEKVEKSAVPSEMRKLLTDRIARLALIRNGAGYMSSTYIMEYESTQRYVNWVTGYPWAIKSQDILDLKKAKEILDQDHYGLDMLKNRMLEYIASIMLNLQNNGPNFATQSPILCFVGLAGTGKTTFAMSIAKALGRQFVRIPFGGMADSRVLRGQSRFFPDAEPGQVYKGLVSAKARNPVLLFDELDRVTETARADIMGVLIELLDPGQNNAFADHYIDYPVDLSNCLFVATANNTTAVSTAVLDRLEIIQMPSYNDEEKTVIGRDFVLPKTKKLVGLKPEQLTIDEAVWGIVIRPLGYDPGIRGLERLINMMCRKVARMIVSGEAKNVRITADNIKIFTNEV